MGERIAILGVDAQVPTASILRAASLARGALGEETPSEFFVWIQSERSAGRVRWFGLWARLRSELYAPSENVADAVAEELDHLLIVRRYGTTCTRQLELWTRPAGKQHMIRTLAIVGEGERVGVLAGKLSVPRGEQADAIRLGLAETFAGEEEQYLDAFDNAALYVLAHAGKECAPTRVDERALAGGRNFLAHFVSDDDALPDRDDAPPTWTELGTRLRNSLPVLAELRAIAARGKALQGDALVGEVLFDAAEKLAVLATVDPQLALMQTTDFASLGRRALEATPEEPSPPRARALLGTLAFVTTQIACGAPMPPFDAVERVWLSLLAKTHLVQELPRRMLHSVLFAALAAGTPGLVPILTGKESYVAKPGSVPAEDVESVLLHLALALQEPWTREQATPALRAFYAHFPDLYARGEVSFFELLCVVRVEHVQLGGESLRGVARRLAALVSELAPPPPPPPAPVTAASRPVPVATAPRPTRTAPVPTHGGWSRLELRDVEGLWGGFVVHVFADGDFWFEAVGRGATASQIFRATLPPHGLAQLGELLARHDVRLMRVPQRHGIPGESHPTLTVSGPGFTHSVGKWANDKHPDFDALAAWLRASGEQLATSTEPIWKGPFDWHYRPDGGRSG